MVRPLPSSRRWPWAVVVAALLIAAAVWWRVDARRQATSAAALQFVDGRWRPPVAGRHRMPRRPPATGRVRVDGQVVEAFAGAPIAAVEVVFASDAGEATTITRSDGRYQLDVAPGFYRAYVRGDGVISVGRPRFQRLPGPPSPRDVGAPDDSLASLVGVFLDQSGVDLEVMRGGAVAGRVFDRSGRPVAGALVRLRADLRPVLGTDVAETDLDGSFQLEAPVGYWPLEVDHDAFAGLDPAADAHVEVTPGAVATIDLTLVDGCIVRGKVLTTDGRPSGDGALERRAADGIYEPAGRIASDGSFRWSSPSAADVVLRAWPWKSPPSAERVFPCRPGARWNDVVFTLPGDDPVVAGAIVTADGAPAAGAYLDIYALTPGGMNQQERADADGQWQVHALAPGDYVVMASVEGGGMVEQRITAPARGVVLRLGGTGSLGGRIAGVDHGSVTFELDVCRSGHGELDMPRTRRVVAVVEGQYRIDGLPACSTTAAIRAGRRVRVHPVDIRAGAIAVLDVDLTPRRQLEVRGAVRVPDGTPAAGATGYVVAMDEPESPGSRFQVADDGSYRALAAVGDIIEIDHVVGDQRLTGAAEVGASGNLDIALVVPVDEPNDEPAVGQPAVEVGDQ